MPASIKSESGFHRVLPRLVAAYEAGKLVPFIGSGMSQPSCVNWTNLILRLEAGAGKISKRAGRNGKRPESLPDEGTVQIVTGHGGPLLEEPKPLPEELIRRANKAARLLRSVGAKEFERAFEKALFQETSVPDQTTKLAQIWWPLVLTTNYDNFFVDAFAKAFDPGGLAVAGRGSEDCQRVLTSLSTAGRSLLWALQGHLGKPCHPRKGHKTDRRLAREIVLDHAEYRRVTHREPHFRRAFAEVFRQRTLLFLGSGISEPYFQELFGEILEFYGPGSRVHYAIMPRGEVDPDFMYSRFQIDVVEYDKRQEVQESLTALSTALDSRTSGPISWSWGNTKITGGLSMGNVSPALEVFCGPLPKVCREEECLVVSAGGPPSEDVFYLSEPIFDTLEAWIKKPAALAGVDEPQIVLSPDEITTDVKNSYPMKINDDRLVGQVVGNDIFAIRARKKKDHKDLSAVGRASKSLFRLLQDRSYSRIHMQLPAIGGEANAPADYSRRPYPARFAFIETVRTWGEWIRLHPVNPDNSDDPVKTRCLILYVVDMEVARELASGRIDVNELLLCKDLRFWAEIVEDDGTLERRVFHKPPETTLRDIVDELGLSSDHWTVEVSPPTSIDRSKSASWEKTLQEKCVIPGGTLHFRRRKSAL